MAKPINHPSIKKATWEAWRSFWPAFAGVVVVQLSSGVDMKDWQTWLVNVIVSASIAGIKAFAKWLREEYGDKNYEDIIYKLPV